MDIAVGGGLSLRALRCKVLGSDFPTRPIRPSIFKVGELVLTCLGRENTDLSIISYCIVNKICICRIALMARRRMRGASRKRLRLLTNAGLYPSKNRDDLQT